MNLTCEVVKRRIKHQIDEVTYHHAGSNPVLTANFKNKQQMEHAYYWMSTVLQIIIMITLRDIYIELKKKQPNKID